MVDVGGGSLPADTQAKPVGLVTLRIGDHLALSLHS